MCGIVGTLDWSETRPPDVRLLRRMLGIIRHRGPDEFGIYLDQAVGLGSARLSIIDLSTGQQPIPNEDCTLWIVFNGEIYNYLELRDELERAGHRFSTHSDTEVIVHLYEDLGPACLERLNGQFAIALWDTRERSLFLARDRVGIRPLFYARLPQGLVFGSEMKAILLDPRIEPHLDLAALAQAFHELLAVPGAHLAGEVVAHTGAEPEEQRLVLVGGVEVPSLNLVVPLDAVHRPLAAGVHGLQALDPADAVLLALAASTLLHCDAVLRDGNVVHFFQARLKVEGEPQLLQLVARSRAVSYTHLTLPTN